MERRLGNIFGFDGGNYAGNVYDQNYMCPTLNTMQGGCKQPMIIDEPKCLNSKGGRGGKIGLQPSVQDRVYSTDTVSTAVTTSFMPSILEENIIVAMRGINPDNSSDRTAGSPTEQRLEPNSQGICNTLTSVQKDNLVLENVYDFYNNKMKNDGARGTITGACSHNGSGTFGVVEESILQMPRGYNKGGEQKICPPITSHSFQENNFLKENAQICIGGLQEHQTPRTDGVSPSLTAAMGMGDGQTPLINHQYRIRKLTPLECWRLMDFSDEDFCKAEQVNSNTQLYRQAGNSIVKNVLVAIFGQMIPGKENVYKEL